MSVDLIGTSAICPALEAGAMLARMATVLSPQAALEQAVVNAIQAMTGGDFTYATDAYCRRMYDGHPPPLMGNYFVSVWYDARRDSSAKRTYLDELFGVYLTITLRFVQPFDRWLVHRDEMEARANALKVLICQDSYNYSIINAANILAGFRSSGQSPASQPVGWCEALVFQGYDPMQEVGADWFRAHVNSTSLRDMGIAQRLKFGLARRVQSIPTAT